MMNLQDHLLKVQLITSETTPQKATQAAETLTKQKQNLKSVSSASSSLSGSVLYFSFAKQNNEQTHYFETNGGIRHHQMPRKV
ncbi:hypothetical protein CUMW_081440 [Citrus unshiu]|nr:hypothetical protein CUMW_081440 [Citrus unshiu]